ncbi:MAG TPA: NAD(P)H-dependent glycerol-3-phosphate dehydrogenase [Terracidiphilus sp.]|jgi:glycerol-3-phosphate dehydrogenase (NAD(P)+)|nr:NAD(P)H-dependent glycerol-3-phosphate dehydrogenase [Terracidiphilus sp.]
MTVLPIAPRIIVLGSGAWGTAIALSLARNGRPVTLWAHSPEFAAEINAAGENVQFLPGFPLPDTITVTGDEEAVAHADMIFSVVPSEFLRATMGRLRGHMHSGQILVSATKGVENGTFLRMTQVIASSVAEVGLTLPMGALSGPSFAKEVAEGQPTAVTVAFDDHSVAALVQREVSSETLRLYTSSDVIGVELGGALKNVIAIAAGIAAGMGLGYNSAAGLMTRGIAEITRLAVACGGRRETLAGLSGVGDLVLTCTGTLSRNRTVGMELGHGRKLPEILASLGGKVAEGVLTTHAALGLARQHRIEMPIAEQMELILEKGKDPREAIRDLMLRPGKHEH